MLIIQISGVPSAFVGVQEFVVAVGEQLGEPIVHEGSIFFDNFFDDLFERSVFESFHLLTALSSTTWLHFPALFTYPVPKCRL